MDTITGYLNKSVGTERVEPAFTITVHEASEPTHPIVKEDSDVWSFLQESQRSLCKDSRVGLYELQCLHKLYEYYVRIYSSKPTKGA